jgi:hypothetical protein
MQAVIEEVRAVVRAGGDESAAFGALREIWLKHLPRRKWGKIQLPALFHTDVLEASKWINDVVLPYRPSNVYVALDTLNEQDGQGKNVATGMTRAVDPNAAVDNWDPSWEGPRERHLVWGLFELHQRYLKWGLEYPASVLADYVMFMGYSGLVYVAAIERSSLKLDCRFVWGFGEGGPYPLVRTSPDRAVRF